MIILICKIWKGLHIGVIIYYDFYNVKHMKQSLHRHDPYFIIQILLDETNIYLKAL